MKLVEFPKNEKDETKDLLEFLDQVRKTAEERKATDAIVITMDEDGNIGMAVYADYIEAMGMLAIAAREF